MDRHLLEVAARLLDQRRPYAVATVVRRERPSSATPGNTALITGDGTVHGFIGGSCTQPEVVRHALAALGDRSPRLLSFGGSPDGRDDMVMVPMSCGSEGRVEVHVNPVFPAPQLVVAGDSPIARAVARLGEAMGYEVADGLGGLERDGADRTPGTRLYAVVATMGQGDEEAVAQLIAARPDYLGVVVSPKRMLQVREYLGGRGICGSRIAEVHGPAGLDIGAERPEEVAVSILAEIVALGAAEAQAAAQAGEARAAEEAAEADAAPAGAPASATDPVCGMTVATDGSRPSFTHENNTYHFCCPGCRARFEADPAAYLAAAG
ncbi:MAG: XdhC family protein [Gemmatimonadetes bacterium]|nr:XdhC family protein [Gemmatimonadota bacterium]